MNYECFIEDFSIHELVGIVTAWMREEYKIYDTQHSHVPFALLESGVFLTRLDVLRVFQNPAMKHEVLPQIDLQTGYSQTSHVPPPFR